MLAYLRYTQGSLNGNRATQLVAAAHAAGQTVTGQWITAGPSTYLVLDTEGRDRDELAEMADAYHHGSLGSLPDDLVGPADLPDGQEGLWDETGIDVEAVVVPDLDAAPTVWPPI